PRLSPPDPRSPPGFVRGRCLRVSVPRGDTGRAMSQENVNVVRGWLRALTDGDLDAMAEFWDPNITWRPIEGIGEMQGREAMRRYAREWVDMFDEITNVPEELLDVGDDCVVAVQRATGRAKGR